MCGGERPRIWRLKIESVTHTHRTTCVRGAAVQHHPNEGKRDSKSGLNSREWSRGARAEKKVNVSSEGEKLPVQLTQKVKECGDRAAIGALFTAWHERKDRDKTQDYHSRSRSIDRSCYVPELECERLSSDSWSSRCGSDPVTTMDARERIY